MGVLLLLGLVPLAGCSSLQRWTHRPTSGTLERADALYSAGDYEPSAAAYREHLRSHEDGRGEDRVLLRLATMHLLPESPVHDPAAGLGYLSRLIESHPDSALTEPARLLRSLQSRIDELEEQDQSQRERLADLSRRLEALKRIDLERSREPPPR